MITFGSEQGPVAVSREHSTEPLGGGGGGFLNYLCEYYIFKGLCSMDSAGYHTAYVCLTHRFCSHSLSIRIFLRGFPFSSVVQRWATGWMSGGSRPGRGWEFFSSPPHPDLL
jgi:hypothetical protein